MHNKISILSLLLALLFTVGASLPAFADGSLEDTELSEPLEAIEPEIINDSTQGTGTAVPTDSTDSGDTLLPEAVQSELAPEIRFIMEELQLVDLTAVKETDLLSYGDFYKAIRKLQYNGNADYSNANSVSAIVVLKELVTLLGQEQTAQNSGGYPYGYIIAAMRAGITKDITIQNGNEPITVQTFCKLLYNTLTADYTQTVGYSAQKNGGIPEEKQKKIKGETLLGTLFDLDSESGILTGTELYDMNGTVCDEGQITIDGVLHRLKGEVDFTKIGHRILYFYNEDAVLFVTNDTETEKSIRVYSEEAEGYANGSFLYTPEDSEKQKRISVPKNTLVLKNGIFVGYAGVGSPQLAIKVERGYIDFIDNDGNGSYDCVSMVEYEVHVVNDVLTDAQTIIAKDKTVYCLREDDAINRNGISSKITYSGIPIEISSLQQWDVLLVTNAVSANGKRFLDIQLVRKTVTGAISEIGETEVFLDGISYKLAPCLDRQKLSVGKYGRYILAGNDEIADVDCDRVYNYGFVMGIKPESTISDVYQMKLCTESGEKKILNLASSVRCNGVGKSSAIVYQTLFSAPQLIGYELNRNGEVSAVYIGETVNKNESTFSLDADHSRPDTTITGTNRYTDYRDDVFIYFNQMFNMEYTGAEDCVVFYVDPKCIDRGESLTNEDVMVSGFNDLTKRLDMSTIITYEGVVARAKLYDTDALNAAGCIVIYRDSKEFDSIPAGKTVNQLAVIDTVSKVNLNEKDYYKVTYYNYSADKVTTYAEADKVTKADNLASNPYPYFDAITSFSQLQCGDVIQIGLNIEGNITSFRPLFLQGVQHSVGDYWGNSMYKMFSSFEAFYSQIQTSKQGSFLCEVDGHDRLMRYTLTGRAPAFIYHTGSKKLVPYTDMTLVNELVPGTNFFAIRSYTNVNLLMLIEE